jgi:hypothetical protein
MAADIDRLQRHEDSLTVVRGCVATLLQHWDKISDKDRNELLEAALKRADILVDLFEEDVAPLRLEA